MFKRKKKRDPVLSFVDNIQINEAISYENLSIIPLTNNKIDEFKCLPFAEAIAEDLASVSEKNQEGSVSELTVQNKSIKPLFLLDGEELLGAKQNRTVNLSILVLPKSSLVIPVTCVEAGRWGFRGANRFLNSEYIYFSEGRRRRTRKVGYALAAGGERFSDQTEVWNDIDRKAEAMGSRSRTRSMNDMYHRWESHLDNFVYNLESKENQIGSLFFINGKIKGMEVFNSPSLFNHYNAKIIKSYAIDALEKIQLRKSDNIQSKSEFFLENLKESEFTAYKALGMGTDLRLNSPSYNSAGLSAGNKLIHLIAFPEGKSDE